MNEEDAGDFHRRPCKQSVAKAQCLNSLFYLMSNHPPDGILSVLINNAGKRWLNLLTIVADFYEVAEEKANTSSVFSEGEKEVVRR